MSGVQPPTPDLLRRLQQTLGVEFAQLISLMAGRFPRVRTYEPALTPTAIAANAEATQTFTVEGLTAQDVVTVNKPKTAGLSVLDAYVSAADTLSITYRNFTGASIDPGEETYRVVAIRL